MFCRGCGYSLSGLVGSACPECGRGFDPEDADTYDAAWPRARRWWRSRVVLWGAACWPLTCFAWGVAMALVARLVLGHWPNASGADDPKSIRFVAPMCAAGCVMLLLIPVSLIVLGARIINASFEPHAAGRWRALALAVAGVAVWALGTVVLVLDPLSLGAWLADSLRGLLEEGGDAVELAVGGADHFAREGGVLL